MISETLEIMLYNELLRKQLKEIKDAVKIDFEILDFCIQTLLSPELEQALVRNFIRCSRDKYTRHLVFNKMQMAEHNLKRIN